MRVCYSRNVSINVSSLSVATRAHVVVGKEKKRLNTPCRISFALVQRLDRNLLCLHTFCKWSTCRVELLNLIADFCHHTEKRPVAFFVLFKSSFYRNNNYYKRTGEGNRERERDRQGSARRGNTPIVLIESAIDENRTLLYDRLRHQGLVIGAFQL